MTTLELVRSSEVTRKEMALECRRVIFQDL